jgi:hypothetical protein
MYSILDKPSCDYKGETYYLGEENALNEVALSNEVWAYHDDSHYVKNAAQEQTFKYCVSERKSSRDFLFHTQQLGWIKALALKNPLQLFEVYEYFGKNT